MERSMTKRDNASLEPADDEEAPLDAMIGSEHSIQVATAKRYPRQISAALERARQMVTLDEGVARSCIYTLPSRDRDDAKKTITGPSARFAELIASAWGNLRSASMFVREEDRFVVARGMCIDLEVNRGYAGEVRRRITTSGGKRYGDDMIGVTSQAAMAIAERNAVLKVIPKAYWKPVEDAARLVMLGKGKTFEQKVQNAFEAYKVKFGATVDEVLLVANKKRKAGDLVIEDLELLAGLITAIEIEKVTTWKAELENAKAIETTATVVTPDQFENAGAVTRETHTPQPAPQAPPKPAATHPERPAEPATAPPQPPRPAEARSTAPAPAQAPPTPVEVPIAEAEISDDEIERLFPKG